VACLRKDLAQRCADRLAAGRIARRTTYRKVLATKMHVVDQ
jgi:hypothetical protein